MDSPFYMLQDGGLPTQLTLLVGLLALLFSAIPGLLFGFTRWRLPASVAWLGAAVTVMVALGGVLYGGSIAAQALAEAPPEMRQTLLAAGLSVSLYAPSVGFFLASTCLGLAALMTAVPAPFRPGPNGTFDVVGLGGSVLGGLLGWVIAAGGILATLGLSGLREAGDATLILPFWTVLLGIPLLLSSVVVDAEDRQQRGRVAGIRMAVGFAGFLSLILAGEYREIWGSVLTTQAMAVAAPEMRPNLLAAGREISAYASTLGWSLALVPLFAGFGAAAPLLRDVGGRQWLGLVTAVLIAMVILLGIFITDMSIWSTFASMQGMDPGV